MSVILEVKQNFRDYEKYVTKIKSDFSEAEEHDKATTEKLANTGKWAGDAHDQCVNAFELLQKYTVEVEDLIDQLGVCLKELNDNKDLLETTSNNVSLWKAW